MGCLQHELRSQDTRDRIILGRVIIRSRDLPLQLICNLLFGHRTNSGSPITPQTIYKGKPSALFITGRALHHRN